MFADPISNLMLIILLFFAGLLVMFVFILRSLDLSAQNQEEERRQIAISLTDLERKVAELAFAMRGKGVIEIESAASQPENEAPIQPSTQAPGRNLEDLASLFDKFPSPEAPAKNGEA